MSSPLRVCGLRHLIAALMCALCANATVHADVRAPSVVAPPGGERPVLTAEEQAAAILEKRFSKFAEHLLRPCIRGENKLCRTTMEIALNAMEWVPSFIRNGVFRYEPMFALRYLNATVPPGAKCEDVQKTTVVVKGETRNLATLQEQARVEIAARTWLPEYNLLSDVSARLKQCGVAAASAATPAVVAMAR